MNWCTCNNCLTGAEVAYFDRRLRRVCMAVRISPLAPCKLEAGHDGLHWFGAYPIEYRDPGDEHENR